MEKELLTFQEVKERTEDLIKDFEKFEKREWGVEGAMIELMKQVGELSKYVMMIESYYIPARDTKSEYMASKEKIADELFDIYFMVVRIARHYNLDLEKEILKQIDIGKNHPDMEIKK